jgi:hypothetical protein
LANEDARIKVALPTHPKTVKLHRRLGADGCWSLVCLILWCAQNRADGDLTGMTDEDIEIAAHWTGAAGAFIAELADIGWLDGAGEGSYTVHDWQMHQPYASNAGARSRRGKHAQLTRDFKGDPEKIAKELAVWDKLQARKPKAAKATLAVHDAQPSYRVDDLQDGKPHLLDHPVDSETGSGGHPGDDLPTANRLSPSPTPTPSPIEKAPPKPPRGGEVVLELFYEFYDAYPRKVGRAVASGAWRKVVLTEEQARSVIEHVRERATQDRQWLRDKQYIPHPATFLNQRRWTDEYERTGTGDLRVDGQGYVLDASGNRTGARRIVT